MSDDMILVHDEINTKIDELEPLVARGQFNQALRRLTEAFETALAEDGIQEARRLVGLVNLLAGERRERSRKAGAAGRFES